MTTCRRGAVSAATAIAGRAEINTNANLEKEGKPLIVDACKEAVKQAVDMTVAKLKIGDGKVKLKKKPK